MNTFLQIKSDSRANETVFTGLKQGIDMDKLIGAPQLFCRYCETREGFMLVPIGVMTLRTK